MLLQFLQPLKEQMAQAMRLSLELSARYEQSVNLLVWDLLEVLKINRQYTQINKKQDESERDRQTDKQKQMTDNYARKTLTLR